ncbi:hypothetical protein [Agriterribacter sp.]|uniref:hypothetical protein n=1 Tax=Agriterribacter sp. TaxID=2821509 RepID=UPI002CC71048|nr:hypothetical protein [Agriterribacter sp.]HRO44617.1 hypothetical protein [Agriterribacter sp.]HRQ16054.1 hypothetical protein [Agriterribacter sp.]
MKKNQNKIIFILVLLAGIALVFTYATHTYKRAMKNDMACSPIEETGKEKILQSDIPFLESLTRHFLILHY